MMDNAVHMKHWQAILALDQAMLGQDSSMHIKEHGCFFDFTSELDFQTKRFEVHVLNQGVRLVEIRCFFEGSFVANTDDTEAPNVQFREACFSLTTSLKVEKQGNVSKVVANLQEKNLRITFTKEQADDTTESIIESLLNTWLKKQESSPFVLFTFDQAIAQAGPKPLVDIAISTSYAEHAPSFSSVLLLMAHADQSPAQPIDYVMDSSILPNGQSAGLWINERYLNEINGPETSSQIHGFLKTTPAVMRAEIADARQLLPELVKSLAGFVQVNGKPLSWTSLESGGEDKIYISATAPNLEELACLTAIDMTKDPYLLTASKADDLLKKAMLFAMRDDLRRIVLKQKKPPELDRNNKESFIAEYYHTIEPYLKELKELAELQHSMIIKDSSDSNKDPFDTLGRRDVKLALRRAQSLSWYGELTAKLHCLAFCIIRPRISLYLQEQADLWKEKYFQFLCGEAWANWRLSSKDPMNYISEDMGKLLLFDPTGNLSHQFYEEALPNLLTRVAQRRADDFYHADPQKYEQVFGLVVDHLVQGTTEFLDKPDQKIMDKLVIENLQKTLKGLARAKKYKDVLRKVFAKDISGTGVRIQIGRDVIFPPDTDDGPLGTGKRVHIQGDPVPRVVRHPDSIFGFQQIAGVDASDRLAKGYFNQTDHLDHFPIDNRRKLPEGAGYVFRKLKKDEPTPVYDRWEAEDRGAYRVNGQRYHYEYVGADKTVDIQFGDKLKKELAKGSSKHFIRPAQATVEFVPKKGLKKPVITKELGHTPERRDLVHIKVECDPSNPNTYKTLEGGTLGPTLAFRAIDSVFALSQMALFGVYCFWEWDDLKLDWDVESLQKVINMITGGAGAIVSSYTLGMVGKDAYGWITRSCGAAYGKAAAESITSKQTVVMSGAGRNLRVARYAANAISFLTAGITVITSAKAAVEDFWAAGSDYDKKRYFSAAVNAASSAIAVATLIFVIFPPVPPIAIITAIAGIVVLLVQIFAVDDEYTAELRDMVGRVKETITWLAGQIPQLQPAN